MATGDKWILDGVLRESSGGPYLEMPECVISTVESTNC